MAVHLIVVQGKHEGKKIPLTGPVFKVGRGETCHLRPNSERVSREHAEFLVDGDKITVRDLGSRNGTLVNGKALTAPMALKNHDVVQVGPLTFAVTISNESPVEVVASLAPSAKSLPLTGSGLHDTDSWNIADSGTFGMAADFETRGGDTVLIPAFTGGNTPIPDDDDSDEGYERQSAESESREELAALRVNPSSPKKAKPETFAPHDSREGSASGAEVMRKMMERLRTAK